MSISFDGGEKLIKLSTGTTNLSVREVYSRFVDWWMIGDNSKYPLAFNTVGGDVIDESAGTRVPVYAFLLSGWRVKPQEADHTLNVRDGILLVGGGGDPFVNPDGNYVVRINYQQPVQAISYTVGGGGSNDADAVADAVWSHLFVRKLLTVGKFLGLK